MGKPRLIRERVTEGLRAAVEATRHKREYQRGLCVWLREVLGLSAAQIAEVLGWNLHAVAGVQLRYRRYGVGAFQDRRQSPLPADAAGTLGAALARARTAAELRRVGCVWLRLVLGLEQAEVAAALGCSRGYVRKVQAEFLKSGVAALRLEADARSCPEGAGAELRAAVASAQSVHEFRRALCLWMVVVLELAPALVAKFLFWRKASVRVLHRQYLRHGAAVLHSPGRGGARRSLLTLAQEDEMFQELRARAWPHGLIPFEEIQRAVEERVGRPVKSASVQAMLDRHGWCRAAVVVVPMQDRVPAGTPQQALRMVQQAR
ncbi:MAG TPA: helix-turn-helix domain-containing protein [Terriglobia bacterium]|nr:helix-turn-helix domain-containing protein [Terriglobia bacterium]